MNKEEAYVWLKKAIEEGNKISIMMNSKTLEDFKQTVNIDDGDYRDRMLGRQDAGRFDMPIFVNEWIQDGDYLFYTEDERGRRWNMGVDLGHEINIDWEDGKQQTIILEEDIPHIFGK